MENSILNTVNVDMFKDYFYRDFPFLPYYSGAKTYWIGDLVYSNNNFYKSLKDNNTGHLLSDATYWQAVKGDKYDYITDKDINKAITQALLVANPRFGETDCEKIDIFLHLVAYYLVVDIKNSTAGVGSSFNTIISSKHVGDVSESYAIPAWMQNNAMYSLYGQNGYGMKYLSLIAPYLATTILYSRGGSTVG